MWVVCRSLCAPTFVTKPSYVFLSSSVSFSVAVCVCVCSELIFDIRFHVAGVLAFIDTKFALLTNDQHSLLWLFEWNNVELEQSISFSFSYHSHSLKIDRLSVWSYDTQNNASDDEDVHISMAVHMASFLSSSNGKHFFRSWSSWSAFVVNGFHEVELIPS